MFCPSCGAEYRKGLDQCAWCRVPLVNQPPQKPQPKWADPVTVLETGDPSLIAVAKSIFEAASIPYFAKGDRLQDLFAGGRLGTGYNPIAGPVQLQVPREYQEQANAAVKEISEIAHHDIHDQEKENGQSVALERKRRWWTATAILIATILVLGVLEWLINLVEFLVAGR